VAADFRIISNYSCDPVSACCSAYVTQSTHGPLSGWGWGPSKVYTSQAANLREYCGGHASAWQMVTDFTVLFFNERKTALSTGAGWLLSHVYMNKAKKLYQDQQRWKAKMMGNVPLFVIMVMLWNYAGIKMADFGANLTPVVHQFLYSWFFIHLTGLSWVSAMLGWIAAKYVLRVPTYPGSPASLWERREDEDEDEQGEMQKPFLP
jgi:hypothetical protein